MLAKILEWTNAFWFNMMNKSKKLEVPLKLSKVERLRLLNGANSKSKGYQVLVNPNDPSISEEMAMRYLASIIVRIAMDKLK